MLDLFIIIILFVFFISGSIGLYVWFWKSNRLWMLFIAINSQIAAFNNLKEIIPNNFEQLYKWVRIILGLIMLTIMYVRHWKIIKINEKNNSELN